MVPATDLPTADPKETLAIINDDMARLRGRVSRLKSRHAHREFPWSRTRRLITNVRVVAATASQVTVTASFAVYRFRYGGGAPYAGRYDYTLVPSEDSLKLRS